MSDKPDQSPNLTFGTMNPGKPGDRPRGSRSCRPCKGTGKDDNRGGLSCARCGGKGFQTRRDQHRNRLQAAERRRGREAQAEIPTGPQTHGSNSKE